MNSLALLALVVGVAAAEFVNVVDWRQSGAVNQVQNEGSCDASWAFATVAALEGRLKLHGSPLYKLSEQMVMDCTSSGSCGGGNPRNAFQTIVQRGIPTSSVYPYQRTKHNNCFYNQGTKVGHCYGWNQVSNVQALQNAVQQGPVVVGVDGSGFKDFHGRVIKGIYYCTGYVRVNHYVTIVGYGHKNGEFFWLLRNSWGSNWADGGYIRMGMNTCGILSNAIYPLV